MASVAEMFFKILEKGVEEGGHSPLIKHMLEQVRAIVRPQPQPPGQILYYQPRFGMSSRAREQPAGADLLFRVKTIEKLQWLVSQAAPRITPAGKSITGFAKDGFIAADFRGNEFRIINGLGLIDAGLFEVEGLETSEAYEEFLLGLTWRSKHGWLSELHALAIAADEDIEGIYDEPTKDERDAAK